MEKKKVVEEILKALDELIDAQEFTLSCLERKTIRYRQQVWLLQGLKLARQLIEKKWG